MLLQLKMLMKCLVLNEDFSRGFFTTYTGSPKLLVCEKAVAKFLFVYISPKNDERCFVVKCTKLDKMFHDAKRAMLNCSLNM